MKLELTFSRNLLCTIMMLGTPFISISQSTIQGILTYNSQNNYPIDGTRMILKNADGNSVDSTFTDITGSYTFLNVNPGTYHVEPQITKAGGGINSLDAQMALKHFIGQVNLTGLTFIACDVNHSALINSSDALCILKYFVGIPILYPVGSWIFENEPVTITGTGVSVVEHSFHAMFLGDVDASYIPVPCNPYPSAANAGPDQTNLPGNIVNLTANTAQAGETGTWSILSGSGGSFTNLHDPFTSFTGVPGVPYTLCWTLSTDCGTSKDTKQLSFFLAWQCGNSTIEYSGQVYHTVQIGGQCWLKENLNVGTQIAGSLNQNNNNTLEKYCYNNDPANCTIYGGLYQWNEMMQYYTTPGVQGICPSGWHIPTDGEWCTMTSFLDPGVDCITNNASSGTIAGGKLKEPGLSHWLDPNVGATNETGFTAIGAGTRTQNNTFDYIKYGAFFWSSTQGTSTLAIRRSFAHLSTATGRYTYYKTCGYSVRCMKN